MTARPAATLVLICPGARGGIEVLMMERPSRGFFGGLWVFPGGAVEPEDAETAAVSGAEMDDFEFRAAALRETAEELGVAVTTGGTVSLAPEPHVYTQIASLGWRLDGATIRLLSQWVTPVGAPKRFDARFYLATTGAPIEIRPDPNEVVEAGWFGPRDALDLHQGGEWAMFTPTLHHLEWLSRFDDVDTVWRAVENVNVEPVEPIVERDGSEVRIRLPDSARLP